MKKLVKDNKKDNKTTQENKKIIGCDIVVIQPSIIMKLYHNYIT